MGKIAQFVSVGTNPGLQAKNGRNGPPRRTVIFFRDTSLKIRTAPKNSGRMVTLDMRGMTGLEQHLQESSESVGGGLFET